MRGGGTEAQWDVQVRRRKTILPDARGEGVARKVSMEAMATRKKRKELAVQKQQAGTGNRGGRV